MKRIDKPYRRQAMLSIGALALVLLSGRPAIGPTVPSRLQVTTGSVQGTVLDAETGMPVAGALVRAPDFALETATDVAGRFGWPAIALEDDAMPAVVEVTAGGYGLWRIEGVRFRRADTLILDISLSAEPVTIIVPGPRQDDEWPTFPMGGAALVTPLDDQSQLPLPSTIRVRVTGYAYCDLARPYTVETVDFKEYVKHVLPNEWVASWPNESLRAGAMAAKMYAWSYIAVGGKWPDADVYDSTCDQVYNPSVSYASTNNAVDFTWNWRLLRSDGLHLFRTFYRATASQCAGAGLTGYCMGQDESRDLATDLYTWDEILAVFYTGSKLTQVYIPPGGYSLRYYGNGYGDLDRVKVAIDDPATTTPGPPSDVGSTDFTLEWWMKVPRLENPAALPGCGADDSWRLGNVLIDRDRFGQNRDYGVSLVAGRIAFGITGADGAQRTLCGTAPLDDGIWHHVAVQRRISDGWMSIYVDGELDAEVNGPDGDISYPDDATPLSLCGSGGTSPCANDPYLVFGAEKHDQLRSTYLSFHGWLDEVRLSTILRYTAAFTRPKTPFSTDASTVGLWHFDEGYGNVIHDDSVPGGPSLGDRNYGGVTNGPEWTDNTHWYVPPPVPDDFPEVVFAVIGDYGLASQPEEDVAELVKSWTPAFVVTTGDNNYPDGERSRIDTNIGQYYSGFIYPYYGSHGPGGSENRFFPSMGNHDWNSENGDPYLDYFTLPGNERYYSFVRGPVEFFILDSDPREPAGIGVSSEQAIWLQSAMADSITPWQIVVLHLAPYTSGAIHGSSTTLQWPYVDWRADAVLAGHEHLYERLAVDGIPYFVNGAGGSTLYDFDTPLAESRARYNDDFGAMRVEASAASLVFEFISRDEVVRDRHIVNARQSFGDVPYTHWAWRYVEAIFSNGLTAGCSADPALYCPESGTTRGEMAVFLKKGIHGASYSPPPPNGSHPFSDLSGHWSEAWVEDLFDEGMTSGFPDGTFGPNRLVSRGEMAVFLLKAKHGASYVPPAASGGSFSDVAGHWSEAWIEQLKEEGITSGYADGTYRPDSQVTRAEMAVFLTQAFDLPFP